MARSVIRKSAKLIFFILIFLVVGKCMVNPYIYINQKLASKLAQLFSGDVNAESLYDAYFYIDVISVIFITIVIYAICLSIFRKLFFLAMQLNMNIEQEIIDYIYENHSHKKYFFFGKRPEVTLDTKLTKGGLGVIWGDAEDTLDYYFKNWNVKLNDFEIIYYFEPDFLGSKPPEKPLKPLTVRMLVESAKADEWLYD